MDSSRPQKPFHFQENVTLWHGYYNMDEYGPGLKNAMGLNLC